jgi:8-amino-7-oxononanoate synthase
MNASHTVLQHHSTASKSSQIVNGYTQIHHHFEQALCQYNGFEDAILVGSGFLANLALIETLVRKKDVLIMDEQYHASGIVASRLLNTHQVLFFKHNDVADLKRIISSLNLSQIHRMIIAIEGVYSMHGDIASKEIFDVADFYDALLLVDEAHSCGVIGDHLLGVFDYYHIKPKKNHVKMGTLGKAYGSYGAYILGSFEVIDFLQNKAKSIIYATALSLIDTALAHESLNYIINHAQSLKQQIATQQLTIKNLLKIDTQSLIVPIVIGNNQKVMDIQEKLLQIGYIVGAIRQPTVQSALIRLIAKIDVANSDLVIVSKLLKEYV